MRFGGRIAGYRYDNDVFIFKILERCVCCSLLMRIYRVGDAFLIQNMGVPIGGLLSAAILGVAFMYLE